MKNFKKNTLLLYLIYSISLFNLQSPPANTNVPTDRRITFAVIDIFSDFFTGSNRNEGKKPNCLILPRQNINDFTQSLRQIALRHNTNNPRNQMNIVELDCQDLLNPNISNDEAENLLKNTFTNSINSKSVLLIKNLKDIYDQTSVNGGNASMEVLNSRPFKLMFLLLREKDRFMNGRTFNGILVVHLEETPDTYNMNMLRHYFKFIGN